MTGLLGILGGLFLSGLSTPGWAAVVYNTQRFCITVDIAFNDEDGGDYWTDDAIDKAARGFRVEVRRQLFGAGSAVVWSGTTDWLGANAGCTPNLSLWFDPAQPWLYTHSVRVYSDGAYVRGNTIHSYTVPANTDEAVVDVLTGHQASVNGATIYPAPLPGFGDKRWNVLALAAFALSQHDGDVDATYTFGEAVAGGTPTDDVGYHFDTNLVFLDDRKRWVYGHELGHAVSEMVAGDAGIPFAYDSPTDNCGDTPYDHHLLEQEWQSAAAAEGIATWYAEIVFNDVYAGADCEIAYFKAIDWDNNGTIDDLASDPTDCIGDPDGAGPTAHAGLVDWLETLTNAPDTLGCNSTLTNKGVEYEWSRYFWSMTTQHGYAIAQMWDVWAAADPSTWDPIGNTADPWDDPTGRMELAAWVLLASPPATGATQAADDHGLDH